MVGKVKNLVCIVSAGLALCAQALAAPVSYKFEASFSEAFFNQIDSVPDDTLYNDALALSSISGVLTYDPDGDVLLSGLPGGASVDTPNAVRIDELDLNFSNGNVVLRDVQAIPDAPINEDSISFQYSGERVLGEGDLLFGPLVLFFFLDSTGAAVDASDFFLPADLSLSDFTAATISLSTVVFDPNPVGTLSDFVGSANVVFDIDRFERVAEVPVPAALPLMLMGLLGLKFVARKRASAA